MVQEIRVNYFIRLGACQGKFLDGVREAAVLCRFSAENGLLIIFSVSSIKISIYIRSKFAIMSLS